MDTPLSDPATLRAALDEAALVGEAHDLIIRNSNERVVVAHAMAILNNEHNGATILRLAATLLATVLKDAEPEDRGTIFSGVVRVVREAIEADEAAATVPTVADMGHA